MKSCLHNSRRASIVDVVGDKSLDIVMKDIRDIIRKNKLKNNLIY